MEFASPPTRIELEEQLKHRDRYFQWHAQRMIEILDRDGRLPGSYPYPLQVWQFGKALTWIAMAGEVAVEYSLRLKRELGTNNLWVAGYCNDVFAYIPSKRILEEGGYEGAGAMIYYVQPGPFSSSVEETLINRAHKMVKSLRD